MTSDLGPLTPKLAVMVLFHLCRIFALLFLSVSVVVAMACYLHQGYLIHRTRSGGMSVLPFTSTCDIILPFVYRMQYCART